MPRAAYAACSALLRVTSDAPEDKLREVERLAFAGCPGISTLRAPVPVETRLEVTRGKAEQAA